jgi:hypothetical protein
MEDAAADGFVFELAEPALDHVHPGARGWCEVEVEAWVLGEPLVDVLVLVG